MAIKEIVEIKQKYASTVTWVEETTENIAQNLFIEINSTISSIKLLTRILS